MNKMLMNLLELMRELKIVEGIFKEQMGVHMEIKSFSSSSSREKKNNKNGNTK